MGTVTELYEYTAQDHIHHAMYHLVDNATEIEQAMQVDPFAISLKDLSAVIRKLLNVHYQRTQLEMLSSGMGRKLTEGTSHEC